MEKFFVARGKFLIVTKREAYVISYNRGMKGARCKYNCDKDGYLRTKINKKQVKVHHIVANLFLGPRPEGYTVNHKDGDKQNNHPSNLEYMTRSDNTKHAFATGNHPACRPETNGRWIDGRTLDKKAYRKRMREKAKNETQT